MLAIVIPFYQKTPGLLTRAITSIERQHYEDDYRIVVVDDASPIGPHQELQGLLPRVKERIDVLKQPNQGPGAARNHALETLAQETSIVAFLDSDDEWQPGHLNRIRTAFERGADFYFSDYRREGATQSQFERRHLLAAAHLQVADSNSLYWYQGNFFDALLRGSPAGTSTVAYNFRAFSQLRFPTFLHACEDILFWMKIAVHTQNVVFSDVLGVHYGKGVNIFESAQWGDVSGMTRTLDMTKYHLQVATEFMLNDEQQQWNKACIRGLESDFMQSAVVCVLRNKPGWVPLAHRYLRIRPNSPLQLPSAMLGILKGKLHSMRRPLH